MVSNQCVIKTDQLQPGMVLAQPVISDRGSVLLEQGVFLTSELIDDLRKWNISSVKIVAPYTYCIPRCRFYSAYKETLQSVTETFERVRAFKEVPIAECKELVENYVELIANIVGVIDGLYTVKVHSEYTFRHSLNVAIISGVLGKWLGLKGQDLKDLILAGLLHDIGKALIPKDILDKPGRLTQDEMAVIHTHPTQGYNLIANCSEIPYSVKLGILQHHEREDGSGYPLAKNGDGIHLYAKIVAIADMYDAMNTERVYRSKLLPFTIFETIVAQMAEKLDAQICMTFLQKVRDSLIGSSVLLSDGNHAKVVSLNDLLQVRPVVRTEKGDIIDLATSKNLEVVTVLSEATGG